METDSTRHLIIPLNFPSPEDNATVACDLDQCAITTGPRVKAPPDVDFRMMSSLAQSLSEYPRRTKSSLASLQVLDHHMECLEGTGEGIGHVLGQLFGV